MIRANQAQHDLPRTHAEPREVNVGELHVVAGGMFAQNARPDPRLFG